MADGVSKKREAILIVALARGAGVRGAAAEAGIAERTVYRRLRESEFQREVQSARATMLADASGRLSSIATRAAETLADLLNSRTESIRLSAARAILDQAPKLREIVDCELRLAILEQRFSESPDESDEPGYPRLVGPR